MQEESPQAAAHSWKPISLECMGMMFLGGKGRVLIVATPQGENVIPDRIIKEGCWK